MNKLILSKPISIEHDNYEILIRKRSDNDYASYCPQLNYMIKCNNLEEVKAKMNEYIDNYIRNLILSSNQYDSEKILEHEA
jgi:hypothetical protein